MLKHSLPTGTRSGYALGAVFVLLAAGIITGGWHVYLKYERSFRTAAEHQLQAIAELKVRELTQYRKERLLDAQILDNPAFAQLARRFLGQPEETADAQDPLQEWLGKYPHLADYDQVRLMDDECVTRFSVPAGLGPADPDILRAAAEVLQSGRIVFQDFYRNQADQLVRLAVLVPIRDGSNGNRPFGVLVLRIDPSLYLYPFIQGWPAPNESGETLLIRRDGDEVVFLNELRFRADTALVLRDSISNKNRPAVMVATGTEGVIEGLDYREVPVIAALRAVPDSPWFMVAKMDTAEVYQPLRERRWMVIAMVGVLILSAGASMGLIWRNQHAYYFKEQAAGARALNLAQATLQAAMDQSPVGIAIADAPAGALRYVNDAGLLIRGGDRETIVNGIGVNQYVASWHLMDLDGRMLGAEEVPLARAILFGETCGREFIIRRDNDEERLVLAKAAPIRNHQGEVVAGVVVFMDVTEHKQMEQQLRLTLADLQRSNLELEQFAYVASHDLQEPLRMVASYTQLLAQRYENQLDAKAQKYIHYAVDGAVRMQTLINDLLAYSRVGMPGPTRQPTDIHGVLDEALGNLATMIEENQAMICSENLPTVPADASQLVLLFQNLIGNAIKFRGAEPPRIQVSAHDCGREWLLKVKDNGIGIDPQHATRVFVIFQRLHTREEYPGTGIGLAICQRIVQHHGGKIWFESTPGHGTTFFFTLSKQPNRHPE